MRRVASRDLFNSVAYKPHGLLPFRSLLFLRLTKRCVYSRPPILSANTGFRRWSWSFQINGRKRFGKRKMELPRDNGPALGRNWAIKVDIPELELEEKSFAILLLGVLLIFYIKLVLTTPEYSLLGSLVSTNNVRSTIYVRHCCFVTPLSFAMYAFKYSCTKHHYAAIVTSIVKNIYVVD